MAGEGRLGRNPDETRGTSAGEQGSGGAQRQHGTARSSWLPVSRDRFPQREQAGPVLSWANKTQQNRNVKLLGKAHPGYMGLHFLRESRGGGRGAGGVLKSNRRQNVAAG